MVYQVDKSPDFPDVHCFWLVRTDGSETEFSYHKCLKVKALREFPSFIDRYDDLYSGRGRRPLAPAANLVEDGRPASQQDTDTQAVQEAAPAANLVEEGRHAGEQENIDKQADQKGSRPANLVEGGHAGQQDLDKQADQEAAPMTVVDLASQSN